MNRIKIVNDKIDLLEIDDSIEIAYKEKNELFMVSNIKIKVIKNTSLRIDIEVFESSKLDVYVNIDDYVNANIYEYKNGDNLKIQHKYYLSNCSVLNLYRFNTIKNIKEYEIINLNKEYATFSSVLKTIANTDEKYDMMIYHNAKNTKSDIINHGINTSNGAISFDISSFVPKDISKCTVNQISKIINLSKNKCVVKPNMYIDCYDVKANHSAHIGGFSNESIFYLMTRGINKDDAFKLLLNGFLKSYLCDSMQEDMDILFNKHWG